ncbi:hypothetical protein [Kocuria rosea]|uniref:hypothetical protein n=1 Tax=Kocuria rosea TaxID=1275 RepID=UPI00119E5D18|nr:hypothetical protein [Kocuria rosea]
MTPTHRLPSPVGRQVLWIVCSIVLCFAVPAWLFQATGGALNHKNPWWALSIIVVSGAAYAGVVASRRRQLFAMVLWLFTYIFVGMAPYVQYRLERVPGTTPYVDEEFYPGVGLLIFTCCVAVLIGNLLAAKSQGPATTMRSTRVDPLRAHLLTLGGAVLFMYYGSRVGFSSFLLSRHELDVVRASVWPDFTVAQIMTAALQMGLLVGFVAQMGLREQCKAAGVKPRLWLAVLNGALLLYVVNPVSTPRYIFGTAALAMLATFGAYASINRFRVMAAAAMVGMVIIFPLADLFRRSTDVTFDAEGPVSSLASGDFDAYVQMANTFDFVSHHGITYGQQLLGVMFLWVPRGVWESKPVATGALLADHMGYDFTNLSAPIWAELFINFGWPLTVIGMGLVGYLFSRWDTLTDIYLKSSKMPPIVVTVVAFYLLIFLRGSLLAVTSFLLVILAASLFVTYQTGRPATLSPQAVAARLVAPKSIACPIASRK